jgi:glycosyltransferase involved in cell wall biosynthesis
MRILLVSDAYPPVFGGATRAAQQLGRQLHSMGHQVVVATAWQRHLPAFQDDHGVAVHRLPGLVSRVPAFSADPVRYTPPPFPDPELVWRLRRLIRSFRPDLVHSYGWLTYSCLPALWRTRIPLILAAREYANICPVRTLLRHGRHGGRACGGPAWRKCLECAGSFYGQPKGAVAVISVLGQRGVLSRRTDALHSVSRFCAEAMRRHVLGSRKIPVEVLPDFRDEDPADVSDQEILARLPVEPFILFLGSFRRIKGDLVAIEAYQQLRNPPPLVMVGARSMEPLPAFPPGVIPLIDVPHATVMAIWDRALFGICPSVNPEALGNTVHEGMSRGKAVIGTHPGGHEDMIDAGHTGLLVRCGDVSELTGAMELLLGDPELRERLGREAVRSARRFSAESVAPQIEAFFRRVARVPA